MLLSFQRGKYDEHGLDPWTLHRLRNVDRVGISHKIFTEDIFNL
jgi:hypothetical protein